MHPQTENIELDEQTTLTDAEMDALIGFNPDELIFLCDECTALCYCKKNWEERVVNEN